MVGVATLDEVRDAFLLWARTITGRKVVLANTANSEFPKLRVPYVEVFITSYENPTYQVSQLSEDGLTETVRAIIRQSIELNIYGGNAMQDASKLSRSLWTATRYLDLWKVCGLASVGVISDLSALETGAIKQRSNFIIQIYSTLLDTFAASFVDDLPVEISVDEKGFSKEYQGNENPREKDAVCLT